MGAVCNFSINNVTHRFIDWINGYTKIIDVFVCKLRKKLAAISGGNEFVETVWGRGYVLRDQKEENIQIGQKEENIQQAPAA